jgi:hypothetical protein
MKLTSKLLLAVAVVALCALISLRLVMSQRPAHAPRTINSFPTNNDAEQYRKATESVREDIKRSQIPLDFYGRVVDENGAGVAGAKISFSYIHFNPLLPFELFRGHGERAATSDSDGNFAIQGVKGYGFMIAVGKDGYDASAGNFQGANIVGGPDKPVKTDASSPTIFRLRKKGAAEPLIHLERSYRLARDGTPKQIDLLTGRTNSPTVDLKIQAWTDEQHKDKEFRYDFRVRIEVINGGILESEKEFDYVVPVTGYADSYELDSPASLGDRWDSQPARRFLLRLRNGQIYGRMIFKMIPEGDHFCRIETWLNPSGSRNLEPDPSLLFRDSESYNSYKTEPKPLPKLLLPAQR